MSARIAKPAFIAICWAMILPAVSLAQFGNNNNNTNNNPFFQTNNVGGVKVDVNGVLQSTQTLDPAILKSLQASVKNSASVLGDDVKLRMISLRGLEAAINQAIENGSELPLEVQYLAGIQKIEYVIASPDSNDILLGGPAEGLKVTARGDVVGAKSGRAALRLDDLMVALQSVDAARTGEGISVSINPTEEGIRNLQRLYSKITKFDPRMQPHVEQAMGDQVIKLTGVPKDSRFSHVLVAADYKMKQISMGLAPAPIKNFPSMMEMAQRARVSNMKAAPRMWMECNYQPLARSEDNLVWQIKGSGVKTLTEEDRYQNGKAIATGKKNRIAEQWAKMMTDRYDELAAAEPVFQELKNLMDMSVVAAIIRKHDLGGQVNLTLPTLAGENQMVSISTGSTPKTVPTRCTFINISGSWLVSTSGGVQFDSWGVVENSEVENALAKLGQSNSGGQDRWWWNAN